MFSLCATVSFIISSGPSTFLTDVDNIQISTVAQKLHVCQVYYYCVVKQSQKQTRQPTYYSITAENTRYQKQMAAAR